MYGWAKKGYAFLVGRIGIQFGLMSLTIKASGIDGSIEDELTDKSLPKIIGLLNILTETWYPFSSAVY